MSDESQTGDGLDLIGAGRIAEAIPDEVYVQTAEVVTGTFQKLVAPLTETTAGLGRYLKQKFDSMVDVERALTAFAIEKAVARARERAKVQGVGVHGPGHAKTFVNAIENASRETDSELHEMWVNLIAGDLSDRPAHPHFVQLLSELNSDEARLLRYLRSRIDAGDTSDRFIGVQYDGFASWSRRSSGTDYPWTDSCALLCEFGLATVVPDNPNRRGHAILFRTRKGDSLLKAVVDPLRDCPPAQMVQ